MQHPAGHGARRAPVAARREPRRAARRRARGARAGAALAASGAERDVRRRVRPRRRAAPDVRGRLGRRALALVGELAARDPGGVHARAARDLQRHRRHGGEGRRTASNGLHFGVGQPAEPGRDDLEGASTTPGLWEQLQRGIPQVFAMDDHIANLTRIYNELIDRRPPPNASARRWHPGRPAEHSLRRLGALGCWAAGRRAARLERLACCWSAGGRGPRSRLRAARRGGWRHRGRGLYACDRDAPVTRRRSCRSRSCSTAGSAASTAEARALMLASCSSAAVAELGGAAARLTLPQSLQPLRDAAARPLPGSLTDAGTSLRRRESWTRSWRSTSGRSG